MPRRLNNLYDLNQYQAQIEEKLFESGGVETAEVKFLIRDLQNKLAINVAQVQDMVEKLEAEEQMAKDLANEWKRKATMRANAVKVLKEAMIDMMEDLGGKPVVSEKWTILLANSPGSVDTHDIKSVPDKYKKVQATMSAETFNKVKEQLKIFGTPKESLDKTKARADIKDFETLEDGQEVGIEGVFITKGKYISVR